MAHLTLALLGPFNASLDEQPITALTAIRLRALLAFLAVEAGRAHSREALAGLFWPERSTQEALSALRYALSNLRRAIGDHGPQPPFLDVTRHTVQFNSACDFRLDVNDFVLPVVGAALPQVQIEQLTAMVTLYRGEFLAGLTLDDSVAFEEWLLLKREQYRRLVLSAYQQLATLHEQRGGYEAAAACTRQLLAIEPWDEPAHRCLMRLLAMMGQRSAALAQYGTCRQMLAGELGVEPEDETTRLYENIRDGTLALHRSAEIALEVARQDSLSVYSPPTYALFVGREGELARMDKFLDLACAGHGRVVFVAGEAGGGKTALLTEFARRAMASRGDMLVAAGRGSAQAGMGDPYLPFREILGQLAGDAEAGRACGINNVGQAQRLQFAFPAVVEALVKAGPGLLDTFVPGRPLAERAELLMTGGTVWRQRLEAMLAQRGGQTPRLGRQSDLFEQVSRVLQTVTRRYPLLLILDDLQWADLGSISLLFHLGRQLDRSRILIACAYRPTDLTLIEGQRHPLQPVVHEFQRDWGDIIVDLDRAEDDSFVDAYLDSEPNHLDSAFRSKFCQAVGGNPLFTVEMVHRLQDMGYLTRDTAGCWIAGSALDWQRMPARVEAIIEERLSRLPAEWRAILDVASVVGEEFEAELVARVLNLDERVVQRALGGSLSKQQRLVQAGGLSRTTKGQRLSRYRFRHSLFQHYLYNVLDEAERANLHEAVGSGLVTLHDEQVVDLASRLAWHFESAGILDKAADYCLMAGHHALRLSAHEDATAHYLRGLALLNRLPQPDDPALRQARLRCELALNLGLARLLGATGGWANPDQLRTYERVFALAQELTCQAEMTPELWQAFFAQVETAAAQGEFRQALVLANRLYDLAQQNGDSLGLGLAHWGLGLSYLCRGANVSAREHLEVAVDLYRNHRTQFPAFTGMDMGVNCLSWLSLTLCTLGYPEQGLVRSREAMALAEKLDLPFSLGAALSVAGCSFSIYCRQVSGAQQYAADLLALTQVKGAPFLGQWVDVTLGWVQVEKGEYEAGITRLSKGIRSWQQMGTVLGNFWHLGLLAEAYGRAGQVSLGLATIEEGLAKLQSVGNSHYEPELYRIHGELLRLSGATEDEIERCFMHAIEMARQHETRWWELRAVMSLARLWQMSGPDSRRRAYEMLAGLYAWFSEGFDLLDLCEARALLEELVPETEQNR